MSLAIAKYEAINKAFTDILISDPNHLELLDIYRQECSRDLYGNTNELKELTLSDHVDDILSGDNIGWLLSDNHGIIDQGAAIQLTKLSSEYWSL